MTDFAWYADLDATELAAAVRSRAVSPVEAVEAALARIAETDGALNACSVVLEEEARAAARASERLAAAEERVGPLHGVPVIVKDVIWLGGAPATLGSHALGHFKAPEDAAVVRRLREAGAIVVAKSTNPDLLWRDYGPDGLHGIARNPWDLDHATGASSGGSAAAVAAGMVPLALGTDAAGSIRKPAAFCGVVGHKPTQGLVPRTPGFEEFRTTNVIGPMTRTVRDAALALDVLAGPDPTDYLCLPGAPPDFTAALCTTEVGTLRIAWAPEIDGNVETAVRGVLAAAIDELTGAGWRVQLIHPELPDITDFAFMTWRGEFALPDEAREELLSPFARKLVAELRDVSARDCLVAHAHRARFSAWWEELLAGYDVLLMPAFPTAAPTIAVATGPRDERVGALAVANLTGRPAVSVPAGVTDDGLPVGLEIMARRGCDGHCLAVARAFEQLIPPRRAPELDVGIAAARG